MIYSNKTSFYRIPIAMDDDLLNETDNVQQLQMIGNSIEAGNGIVTAGVISEGNYVEIPDSGSGYKILLQPQSEISIKALMNGGFAKSEAEIAWEGLYSGNFYYLYLHTYDGNIYKDPTAFVAEIKTTPVSSDNINFLYMATFDLTGVSPVLDTNPFGKIYARGFTKHIADHSDPHSTTWTQTNLSISGSLDVKSRSNQSVNISQKNVISSAPLIVLNHVAEDAVFRTIESDDFRITESGDFRILEGGGSGINVPLIRSIDEFVIQDLRMTTQISEAGEFPFDNEKDSIVGAINKDYENNTVNEGNTFINTSNIATNTSDIAENNENSYVNLGSGTTDSVCNNNPVTNWGRTVCQFVYTATELIAAGISPTNSIMNQIGWYVTEAPIYDIPGYTIKMKHVTVSDVSSPLGTEDWTEIKSAFTYAPTAGGYDLIDFDQDFIWNGIDNIGIEICWSQVLPNSNFSGSCLIYYPSPSEYAYRFDRFFDAGSSCGDTPVFVETYKPQAKIGFLKDLSIIHNTEDIFTNQTDINFNTNSIFTNFNAITGNAANIITNAANITGNFNAITGNTANINLNYLNITALTGQVEANYSNLSVHEIELVDTDQRIEALECAVFGWCSSSSSSS